MADRFGITLFAKEGEEGKGVSVKGQSCDLLRLMEGNYTTSNNTEGSVPGWYTEAVWISHSPATIDLMANFHVAQLQSSTHHFECQERLQPSQSQSSSPPLLNRHLPAFGVVAAPSTQGL